jgi:hypothetical protein
MIAGVTAALVATTATAQYDSQTLVDTNNTSTSTSTVTSTNTNTNTNNNVNDTTVNSTATNTNTNINTSTSTNNNNNVNTNTSTSTNSNTNTNTNNTTSNNTNVNINSGEQTFNNNNVNDTTITSNNNNVNTSDNTNRNVNTSTSENRNENVNRNENTTKIEQPPPTAVAPSMMSGGNNDLCTTGTSGAVQTQILGVSSGGTVRDLNCERLKNAKTLYDMGMKVAAVSVMCQDRRVFDAMWNAGTPCPFEGMIGTAAKLAWEAHPDRIPPPEEASPDDFYKKTAFGAFLGALLFGIF